MSFTPITTEDEFSAAIQERLNRERAKFADYDSLKAKAKQYDDLIAADWESKAKQYEADLGKARQAKDDADEAKSKEKARADKAEKALMRYKIAGKYKLPSDLADRLRGDTEADMTKDAESLAQLIGQGKPSAPHFRPDAQVDPSDKDAAKTAALKTLLDSINSQN